MELHREPELEDRQDLASTYVLYPLKIGLSLFQERQSYRTWSYSQSQPRVNKGMEDQEFMKRTVTQLIYKLILSYMMRLYK